MSNIKKGSKLTVSTGNGISRHTSNNLGVLEVSGPGLANVVSQDSTFSLASSNIPQLSIGAIDNSGIFQLGLDNQGNAILESTENGTNNNILIQQLGGYVGIGTDNPASTLHVNSTDAVIIPVGTNTNRPGEAGQITAQDGMIRYNTSTSQFEGYGPGSAWGSLGGVKDVDGDTYILAESSAGADNDALQFFTGGQERVVIDSSGYVGIGTTSPDELLHVNVNTSNTAEIYPLIISNDYTFSFNTGNDIGCGIGFKSHWKGDGFDSPTVMTAIESHKESSANYGDSYLSFKTRRESNRSLGGVGVLAERMRIDSNGNVGIGTTSPGSILEVYDNSAAGEVKDILHVKNSGGYDMVSLGTSSNFNSGAISLYANSTTKATPTTVINSNGNSYFNEGNVGIGTTSPDSKLHVISTNIFDGIRVEYSDTNAAGVYIGYGGISSLPGNRLRLGAANTEYMSIDPTGNVGIGTTSPYFKLEVKGGFIGATYDNDHAYGVYMDMPNTSLARIQTIRQGVGYNYNLALQPYGGNVGIGTTTPGYPLSINGGVSSGSPNNLGSRNYIYVNGYAYTNNWTTNPYPFSAYFSHSIIVMGNYIVLASDRRIKKDITDVNDSYALTTLRNIPVRYYYYRDKNRSPNRTIGFIAQEVYEVLPEAISLIKQVIPDEMRILTDISWNGNTLYTDLSDCSGVKYKFYVSNDPSGNDEIMKEVIGNSDNSFTFESNYNTVFCYGKEVDDFHSIDKNKLYTINFSATQEIDRIQQQEIIKVQTIQTDLSNANATIQTLQTDLSNANATIQQQATTIQQQSTTIQTLETQIADILTRLSNLENTSSG